MQTPEAFVRPPTGSALAIFEPEVLIDLAAENAELRAALALSEGAGVARELVTKELAHRIGNLVTVIQAVARKSFRDADAARVEDFNARLSVIAAAQKLLIETETRPALLVDVVSEALAPHCVIGDRCRVSGPQVTLNGRRAHALMLALHELATNAAKYGALSVDAGWVEVDWRCERDQLVLCWRERSGPAVTAPTRRGFGSSLITLNLRAAFSGSVDLSFEPDGVQCLLRAPLPHSAAVL